MTQKLYFFLFLFLAGCSRQLSQDDVIVQVNDRQISVRDYLNVFERMKPKDVELQGVERAEIKNLSLQTLIARNVILSVADRQNIQITPEELNEALKKYKDGYGERFFRESLLEGMVEEEEWTEQVKQNLLIDKLFQASKKEISAPTLKEAHQYFEENESLFSRPSEVKAHHIVVGDSDQAKKIWDELKKKPSSFVSLAKLHSTGPESQGDATIRVEGGVLSENLDQYLFTSPIGQISPIIQTDYGFHIVRVLSRKEAVNLDFNQVKNEIFEKLYEQNRQKWLTRFEQDLIREAEIEYNRELISAL